MTNVQKVLEMEKQPWHVLYMNNAAHADNNSQLSFANFTSPANHYSIIDRTVRTDGYVTVRVKFWLTGVEQIELYKLVDGIEMWIRTEII
jgi:hypothetical protein